MQLAFDDILDAILGQDDRYAREAYHFVREALDHTQRKVHLAPGAPPPTGEHRHVTGRQLLEGVREYALQQFGPMTFCLFESWGIRKCEDFGEIVFNLVENGRGMFGKTEQDSREDFRDGYDFREVFQAPYLPAGRRPSCSREMREV